MRLAVCSARPLLVRRGLSTTTTFGHPRDITVLGAGLSGLVATYRLSQSLPPGSKLRLIDSSHRLGGWVDSTKHALEIGGVKGEVVLEGGPRSLRPRGSRGAVDTLRLIRDLGLADSIIPISKSHPAARNRFLLLPPATVLTPLPSSLFTLLRSSNPLISSLLPAILKEPFRPRLNPRPGSESGDDITDESVDTFLKRRFGNEVATLASAMIHGIYAASSTDLSVRSGLSLLWDAESKWGSVVLGMIGGIKSRAEKAQEAKEWAELGELGTKREEWSLYGIQGGLGSITQKMREEVLRVAKKGGTGVEVDIHLDEAVKRLGPIPTSSPGPGAGVGVEVITSKSKYTTQHVISALAPSTLDTLLSDSGPLPHLSYNPSTSVGVVSLVFPLPPAQVHPNGFGYLIPRPDPEAAATGAGAGAGANPEGILGVVFDSTAVPGLDGNLEGRITKLTVMLGGPYWSTYRSVSGSGRPSDPADLLPLALKHLRRVFPVLRTIEPVLAIPRLHVNAIPTYLPNHGARLRELDYALRSGSGAWEGRLSVVGSGYGGVGVNDVVGGVEGVVRRLLRGERVTGLERWEKWV